MSALEHLASHRLVNPGLDKIARPFLRPQSGPAPIETQPEKIQMFCTIVCDTSLLLRREAFEVLITGLGHIYNSGPTARPR